MRILVVSNGQGEDSIGRCLVEAMGAAHSPVIVPLVGEGQHYAGYEVALRQSSLPSGGFIRSFKDLIGDIRAGLFGHIKQQFATVKTQLKTAEGCIVIGDVYALLVAVVGGARDVTFLPTAKSDRFMPHSLLECWLMRKTCVAVFTRDQETADSLAKMAVPAHYAGNVMMDLAPPTTTFESRPYIGILPGSRAEAYANFRCIMQHLEAVDPTVPALVSLPPTLSESQLRAEYTGPRELIFCTELSAVITQSSVIVGLAGTANEQAAYYGRPVICFEGMGPQTTATRFREQQKLMQDNIFFYDDPAKIALAVTDQLAVATPITFSQSAAYRIVRMLHLAP